MVQISRFWDGTTLGDATVAPYDAGTEFSEVMMAVSGSASAPDRGGAIRTPQGELAISSPSAGIVRVGPGEGMSYGAWYKSDAAVDHTFATPAAAARTDRIILRKSWASQTVRQVVLTGAEGGGVPTLTQIVGDTWDVPIAQIAVATNGNITITDQRYILGTPPTDQILTDPIIRDTVFFGAKPAGVPDASIRRIAAGQLAAPNQTFTTGIMQADGPLAQERALKFLTNGVMRWFWGIAGGSNEAGGNSGSDQGLYRYADNGAFLGAVTGYRRSDGLITHHTFTNFLNATQWGTGQRIADEGGTLVWRRPGDNAGTLTLDNGGSLSAMNAVVAGGNLHANGGYVYAGGLAGSYLRMDFSGMIFANNGQSIVVNPSSAYFHPVNATVNNGHPGVPWADLWTNHVSCYGDIVTNAVLRMHGGVGSIVAIANISLSPGGGVVHPDTNGTRTLGHTSHHWADVITNRVYSSMANPLNVEAQNGSVQCVAHGAGAPVNLITDTGQMQFQTGDGYAIFPMRHNTIHFGTAAIRWMDGWGVGGWQSGSTREWKQNWSDLPEGQALAALRLMQFGRFEYKVPDTVRANTQVPPEHILSRWSVGYIAEDTVEVTRLVGGEDLFVSRTGRDVEPQRTASVVGAAVQDLDREIHRELAMLRERIAELERKQERVYANVV